MKIYGIGMVIQSVEKELYELEYALNKEEIRRHGSNVFILTENIIKELVYIYGYLLYGKNYKDRLAKYGRTNKLMFGKAINILEKINKADITSKSIILNELGREYLVFDPKSNLLENLIKCSKIRGKILHEHGLDIDKIEEYKNEVKRGIELSFNSLRELKDKDIFPTIVEFDSTVHSKEKNITYFRDEIGTRIPIIINNYSVDDIKNNQWYIFRYSNIQNLVPVVNKIDAFVNDTIEPKICDLNIPLENNNFDFGYLKIIGDDKIISINSRKLTVGRLSTNNIHLTNRSISRKHCLIEVIDKYVYLVDLGSKFGTYLNDRKLIEGERVLITSNDIISIGMGNETVKFIYKVGEKDIDER
ncbi:TPA: FHA domain-containing protein [Clostridium perfringens]|uniref:FHA domain-containing protein n=2 Tax=Clostridium perfringens TaxID=1502 RepID=UPI001A290EBA|nr:FHA domain-containing protein [Clostridium perfringens]EGT0694642.1 FHA domain-containing protein [Clostridium perfringens]EGT3602807.1 FHA domain-containing protein [Clostridium perfringens]MDB2062638.1 FHA domain-containing protein [Clostridium perfringens]MDB2065489.1 FHA domain-containing protein [Clostridium perfringens]MDK0765906.1 FHA domain-containing protein [Clostridium perfringens]